MTWLKLASRNVSTPKQLQLEDLVQMTFQFNWCFVCGRECAPKTTFIYYGPEIAEAQRRKCHCFENRYFQGIFIPRGQYVEFFGVKGFGGGSLMLAVNRFFGPVYGVEFL